MSVSGELGGELNQKLADLSKSDDILERKLKTSIDTQINCATVAVGLGMVAFRFSGAYWGGFAKYGYTVSWAYTGYKFLQSRMNIRRIKNQIEQNKVKATMAKQMKTSVPLKEYL